MKQKYARKLSLELQGKYVGGPYCVYLHHAGWHKERGEKRRCRSRKKKRIVPALFSIHLMREFVRETGTL